MAEYGKLVKSTFILHVPDNEEKGFSTAKFLAENSFRTKAIIYASPKFAMQGLEVIKTRNIRIGRDISIISVGDFPGSDSCEPPISVLRYNYFDTGKTAADMLFRRMRQPEKLFCESSKGHWDFIFRESSVGIGKQPLCLSELQKQRWNERFRSRRSIW
jgi:DNA-binding LacI/PurR family transcriptional regulator